MPPWPSLAENEWPILGENTWTSLGENDWPSLGENLWPIIVRKMTLADRNGRLGRVDLACLQFRWGFRGD